VATEQTLLFLLAIVTSETVLPYGQMVISYDVPEAEEDLWVFDFLRALLRFDLSEAIAKVVAYAIALKLFLNGEVGSAFIVLGIVAVNVFYLARKKLDRFYQARSAPDA
jgi:hypothetical protein